MNGAAVRDMRAIREIAVPPQCRLAPGVPSADFYDSWQIADPRPDESALESWLAFTADTPAWMNALMNARNRIVGLFGLKNLGRLAPRARKPSAQYAVGDRVGIFRLNALAADEVVLGDDDKHLAVEVSLLKHRVDGRPMLALTTVVHVHNTLGHAYMVVVGPAHRLIVPRLLRRALERGAR